MNRHLVIAVLALVAVSACKKAGPPPAKNPAPWTMTKDECAASGGHEESAGDFNQCSEKEFLYAHVVGLKCSCICCGPDSSHSHIPKVQSKLESIPLPKSVNAVNMGEAAHWKNPVLNISAQGIEIEGRGHFSSEEIEAALVGLPKTDWPYGRVIAMRLVRDPDRAAFNVVFPKALSAFNSLRLPTVQLTPPNHRIKRPAAR